jgi:hypothetical protein
MTFGHPELAQAGIDSLLPEEEYEILDVKAGNFQSLAAAQNDAIARNVMSGRREAVIVMNDDVTCIDPRPTGKYLLQVLKEYGPQFNVIMTVGYDVNMYGDRGLVMTRGSQQLPGSYCMCITRQLIDKIGWFDERFKRAWWEDTDMWRRIYLAGYEIASLAPVRHIGSGISKIDPGVARAKLKYYPQNQKKYAKKWGGLPGHETIV